MSQNKIKTPGKFPFGSIVYLNAKFEATLINIFLQENGSYSYLLKYKDPHGVWKITWGMPLKAVSGFKDPSNPQIGEICKVEFKNIVGEVHLISYDNYNAQWDMKTYHDTGLNKNVVYSIITEDPDYIFNDFIFFSESQISFMPSEE